ncbi:NodT family efflux transporter outer membrane factor (OMF) lipoprotein [Oxalobacteraceae bacterium GrIS 2.11]
MKKRFWPVAGPALKVMTLALGASLLHGCSLAPVYQAPTVAIPDNAWQDNMWQLAKPVDDQPHGNWWQLFNDPTLNRLEDEIDAANPGLAAALARYDEASAYTRQLQGGQGPSLDGGGSLTDNRQSKDRPLRGAGQPNVYDATTVGLGASYALDIWGQVRNLVAAGQANEQASAADLETARLSLHASLADSYVSLRGVDAKIRIYQDATVAYTKALELTQRRFAGGVASGIDVARAQTQLSSTRSEASELLAQRAIYEHAIASLTGQTAMSFTLAAETREMPIPDIPVSLPSELLLRRPDIAAAERRTAAANASIGVARAAYYPNLSLGATYGVQNTGKADLFSIPNTFWSLGPAAVFNLFDSGRHDAQLAQAKAALQETSATYRSVVLAAFQQVEDNLSRLKYDRQSAAEQQQAMQASDTALTLAMNRYREGAVNYLEVVTSQEAALNAAQRATDIHTRELKSSVDLVRALGGGWTRDSSPQISHLP